jgi:hypothetical protein
LRPPATKLQNPSRGQFAFQTDILIRKANANIPLVAIELKFGRFTTHDIITYSSKATRHKEIYPYLRYGFLVGEAKPLSKKFLTHNQGIDFAMSVSGTETGEGDTAIVELVERQIGYAERLVVMMAKNRISFTRYETAIEIETSA